MTRLRTTVMVRRSDVSVHDFDQHTEEILRLHAQQGETARLVSVVNSPSQYNDDARYHFFWEVSG